MGWRFRKSFSPIKGLRINLGKRGIGMSVGVRGFRVGVNSRGTYTSASIPGTGLSYFEQHKSLPAANLQQAAQEEPPNSRSPRTGLFGCLTILVFAAIIGALLDSPTRDPAETVGNTAQSEDRASTPSRATRSSLPGEVTPTRPSKSLKLRNGIYQLKSAARLRSAPDGNLLFTLPARSYIEVTGRNQDGWFQVNTYYSSGNVYPGVISGREIDATWVMETQQAIPPQPIPSEPLEVPVPQQVPLPRSYAQELPSIPPVQQEVSGVVYITQTGEKFHRAGCRYLKSSIAVDRQEAMGRGYSSCSVCRP